MVVQQGRMFALVVAGVLALAAGCSKQPAEVVEPGDNPKAPKASASGIQWTMRPVKYEEEVKEKMLREGGGAGGAPGKDAKAVNDAISTYGAAPGNAKVPMEKSENLARPATTAAPAARDPSAPHPTPARPEAEQTIGGAVRQTKSDKAAALEGREERYKNGEDKKDEAGHGKQGQPAQVWKRDRQRPTFARVYVGSGNSLELVSIQVTTTIEGPRARTVVDHIFRNPHDKRLEGTFEYPLPTGASPSYFAMFLGQTRDTVPPRFARRGDMPPLAAEALASLTPAQLVREVSSADWGTLQEARVVNKERALETYEDIVRSQIDPALLEYAGGNTFSGRVFPIPPKGYNRVILAYEELLPISQGQALYRFPLPDCKLNDMQFTLQAIGDEYRDPTFLPETKSVGSNNQHIYTKTWTDKGPGGDVVFSYYPARPRIQFISGQQGSLYGYARIRPELKGDLEKAFASHAIFLLDVSQSENPDRFAVSMKLLKKILEEDTSIQHFNILAFNVGASWLQSGGWLPNSASGREQALKKLDGIVLEGATDLSAALDKLSQPDFPVGPGTPVNVFLLSDGQITWGEPDVGPLVSRFESRCTFPVRFHCYRTGIGADNQELYNALTRKGGGTFNVLTEADLPHAAVAHRSQCLQVEQVRIMGDVGASEVLIAGRQGCVYPGGELVITGKLAKPGHAQIVVEGTYLGQKYSEEYPVEITGTGELAARGWGEVAVASLLALDDPKLDKLVTAYCQEFGIGSRVASFLVLENNDDFQRLNLQEERGKTVAGGDLSRFLNDAWRALGAPVTPKVAFERFFTKVEPRVKLFAGENGPHVKKLLSLLKDEDFEVNGTSLAHALVYAGSVPADYLKARDKDRRQVDTYLTEARRRADAGDAAGAIRVLSSIIEEYPARSDALRLVGYRLLDLQQAGQAVRLFQQVQRSRPFEPHSYRDLARSLEESGQLGLAALQYEIVLAGDWHGRFRADLKTVAREEYARMMQQAIRKKAVRAELLDHFGARLEKMADPSPRSDLRVTISWNTDATDIDLWVIEPDGTRCYYQNKETPAGGRLSDDQTQGYGPERYHIPTAKPGEYTVIVHYFSANPSLLGGETNVNVVVAKNAGSPDEVVERRTVILKKDKEQIEVCKIRFGEAPR